MLDPNLAYKCPFSSFIASRTVSSSFLCASTSFVCVSTARWSCVSADFWEVWTKHSPTTSWHVSESSRKAISPSASSASSRRFCCCYLLLSFYCRLVVSSIRCHHSRESNIKRSKKRAGKSNPKNASKMENEMTTTTPIYTIYLFRGHQGLELVRFASQTTERAYLLLVFPRDLDVVGFCCRPSPRRHFGRLKI